MKRLRTKTRWVIIGALLMVASGVNAQQTVLLGQDLESKRVLFTGLAKDGVRVTDRFGAQRTVPAEQVLRLSFSAPAKTEAVKDATITKLVDGQVLVGHWSGPGDDGESIRMKLSALGKELEVPLDDVMSVTLRDAVALPNPEEDDIVLLATGETLAGFIEAVNVDSIEFIVGDADDPIQIPLERVHGFAIANKPQSAELDADERLIRVKLHDGSTYLLKSAETAESSTPASLRLTGLSVLPFTVPVVSLPRNQIAHIEPLYAQRSLQPLMGFDYKVAEGGEVFGVPMPPKSLPDGSLSLHAPVTLDFDLPKGASRVAFSVGIQLGEDVPPSRQALAGCELEVYAGDEKVGSFKLSPDNPPQRINLPLVSPDLRIEVVPGVNGPVLDRVVLTDAELLVGTP